jgi:hypothetical protein
MDFMPRGGFQPAYRPSTIGRSRRPAGSHSAASLLPCMPTPRSPVPPWTGTPSVSSPRASLAPPGKASIRARLRRLRNPRRLTGSHPARGRAHRPGPRHQMAHRRASPPQGTTRTAFDLRGRLVTGMTVLAGPEPGDMRASRAVHGYDAGSSGGRRRSAWRCTIRHPAPPACRQMCVTLSVVSGRAAPSTRAMFLSMSIE